LPTTTNAASPGRWRRCSTPARLRELSLTPLRVSVRCSHTSTIRWSRRYGSLRLVGVVSEPLHRKTRCVPVAPSRRFRGESFERKWPPLRRWLCSAHHVVGTATFTPRRLPDLCPRSCVNGCQAMENCWTGPSLLSMRVAASPSTDGLRRFEGSGSSAAREEQSNVRVAGLGGPTEAVWIGSGRPILMTGRPAGGRTLRGPVEDYRSGPPRRFALPQRRVNDLPDVACCLVNVEGVDIGEAIGTIAGIVTEDEAASGW
jgi:hypothetical protein